MSVEVKKLCSRYYSTFLWPSSHGWIVLHAVQFYDVSYTCTYFALSCFEIGVDLHKWEKGIAFYIFNGILEDGNNSSLNLLTSTEFFQSYLAQITIPVQLRSSNVMPKIYNLRNVRQK